MKKTTKTLLACALALALVFAMTGCNLLGGLLGGGTAHTGKADKRLTGVWTVEEGEEENSNYGYSLKFTENGTIEYGFSGDLALPETSETSGVSVDLSGLNEALGALNKLVTTTYEVTATNEITLTMYASIGGISESSKVEFSFDGDVLVFDGTRYVKAA